MFLKPKACYSFLVKVSKYSQNVAKPLRSKKPKSLRETVSTFIRNLKIMTTWKKTQNFLDFKELRATGGKGGDGCMSFLSLWCNEFAGPDGGDGGNGGHVIFQACNDVQDLYHVPTVAKANDGEKGM